MLQIMGNLCVTTAVRVSTRVCTTRQRARREDEVALLAEEAHERVLARVAGLELILLALAGEECEEAA